MHQTADYDAGNVDEYHSQHAIGGRFMEVFENSVAHVEIQQGTTQSGQ